MQNRWINKSIRSSVSGSPHQHAEPMLAGTLDGFLGSIEPKLLPSLAATLVALESEIHHESPSSHTQSYTHKHTPRIKSFDSSLIASCSKCLKKSPFLWLDFLAKKSSAPHHPKTIPLCNAFQFLPSTTPSPIHPLASYIFMTGLPYVVNFGSTGGTNCTTADRRS